MMIEEGEGAGRGEVMGSSMCIDMYRGEALEKVREVQTCVVLSFQQVLLQSKSCTICFLLV